MKKKKIIVVSLLLLLLAYFPLSPVFTSLVYGTQPKSTFQASDSYAYLRVVREESFQSFLFLGFWRFEFRGTANLMFRSEQGKLKAISITEAFVEIDGKKQALPQVSGRELQMDFSDFNMFGGVGSSGIIQFDLPSVPEDSVNLHITGIAVDSDGSESPFDLAVRSQVKKSKSTMCLFEYFIAQLTKT